MFAAVLSTAVRSEQLEQQQSFFDLQRMHITRTDRLALGKSDGGGDIDVSTPAGATAAVPIGLTYLLFAPFPWSIRGLRELLTLPEMLVWYSLMPALVRGLMHAVRNRLRECLPILVFAGMLMIAYSIFQGSVGTVYRQRTHVRARAEAS